MQITIFSNSSNKTINIGKIIGNVLLPNDIIFLSGDLGAGKTTLTKGIALGLGVVETVTSPTFDILKSYSTKKKDVFLCHVDAYRMEKICNDSIGINEIANNNILVIEWATFIKKILSNKNGLEIILKYKDGGRQIIIKIPKNYNHIKKVFNEKILSRFR